MSKKTLNDEEIETTTRGRRSAIVAIGATALGVAAVVAGATLGRTSQAEAQADSPGHGRHCSDSDPRDPGGHGSHCTDTD